MPTENPKISAYVPQIVYDRFKQYQDERQLSMSQAVAQLITEYFGIDLSKNITEQSTSELPIRLSLVEQELEDLKQKTASLLVRVDNLQSTSELPISFNDQFFRELLSRLFSESQANQVSELLEKQVNLSHVRLKTDDAQGIQGYNPDSESFSSLLNESLNKTDLLESVGSPSSSGGSFSSELKDELDESLHAQLDQKVNYEIDVNLLPYPDLVDPLVSDKDSSTSEPDCILQGEPPHNSKFKLSSKKLAYRLGTTDGYIQNQRSKLDYEQFTKWTTQKDPNRIGWQSIKEGRKVYYVPATNDSFSLSLLAEYFRVQPYYAG